MRGFLERPALSPAQAIACCLRQARLNMSDLDAVVFCDKPITKFARLLETYLAVAPFGFHTFVQVLPSWSMKPKLQENPREWQRFVLTAVVSCGAACGLLWRRGAITTGSFAAAIGALGLALVFCWLRPFWFRPIYRAVVTASFYVGQFMGRVMLALFFLVALTVSVKLSFNCQNQEKNPNRR